MKISEKEKERIRGIYKQVKADSRFTRTNEWLMRETQRRAGCTYEDVIRSLFSDKIKRFDLKAKDE
jgi:hypothetical protein